jgi:coenzyme F420-reducing hydrogenase alpha subunit
MLNAPDFLGYPDAVAMAKVHPEPVRRGLRIKKAGNAIVATLGGREIHPVNVRVGGFYRAPSRNELAPLLPEIDWAVGAARESLEWASAFSFPQFERDYEFVALRHGSEYPFSEGRIASNKGLDVDAHEFDACCVEEQVPYSTALHARLRGRGAYVCGPLARFNVNFDRLSRVAQEAAGAVGLAAPCKNPFKGILVRLVEIVQALDEAKRIIEGYTPPGQPFVDAAIRAGTGYGATEAPRGLLFHRYVLDADGLVTDARIVPPTSQNQKSIEDDLAHTADALASLPLEEATWRAEQIVRNYDPCISCSTHFLDCRFERD